MKNFVFKGSRTTPAVFLIVGLFLFGYPFLVGHNPYYIHVLITILIGVTLAVSLRLILTTGVFSFAHAAFMAIGGYASVLLVTRLNLSFWAGLPLGIVASGIIAYLLARLALRVKGIFFGVLSIAFAQMIVLFFANQRSWTGGWFGLDVPRPDPIVIAGRTLIEFSSLNSIYYLGLVLVLISIIFLYRLDKSPLGTTMKDVATNEELAKSIGVNTHNIQTLAFVIGCMFAALVGIFEVFYASRIHSSNYDVWRSITIYIYVVVGGKSLAGAVLGATVLLVLTEMLRDLVQYQHIFYAVVLIIIALFLQGGLISLVEKTSRLGKAYFKSRSKHIA